MVLATQENCKLLVVHGLDGLVVFQDVTDGLREGFAGFER